MFPRLLLLRNVALLGTLSVLPLAIHPSAKAAAQCTGFAGDCAPVNWALSTPGNGNVDFTGAPGSVVLTSNDTGVGFGDTYVTMSIDATNDGLVEFAYDYLTDDRDGSGFDPFGYIINGSFNQIVPPPFLAQGGTVSGLFAFNVQAGDAFGFYARATDSQLGSSITTVSNFTYIPTSVPGPFPLLGAGSAFAWSRRMRKRILGARTSA